MKKYFLLLATIVTLFAACKEEDETPTTAKRSAFVGTLAVDQSDSSTYTQDSVLIDVVKKGNNTADIIMYQVKFAPRMPFKIDMTIGSVSYTTTATDTVFSGNLIVPTAGGIGYNSYTITNMSGTIANRNLTLSMMCGTNPLRYSGNY